MKVVFCDKNQQQKWDEFVKMNSSDFGLLQSWAWGEFQSGLGQKIFRLAVEDEGELLAVAQIIKQSLRFGKNYFYLPRGPILKTKESLDFLLTEIKKLAEKESAIFIRIETGMVDRAEHRSILGQVGFKFFGQVQPKQTLILNLSVSESELLAQMKQKTRYNIKLAQKHNIAIDEGEKYFEDFWRLMEKTSVRDQFVSHAKDYYKRMLATLGSSDLIRLVVAKDGDKVIAANLLAYFGKWAVYLHGASDYDYRDKMAPYLLQWYSIQRAQKSGLKYYDFWGTDEKKWPGVTRFKQGFSPQLKFTDYVGAWDRPLNKIWYNIYRLVKK